MNSSNTVTLQNVVDQSQALRTLIAEGVPVNLADCAYLSPYSTQHLKRFGDYPKDLVPDAEPATKPLLDNHLERRHSVAPNTVQPPAS